MEAFYNDITGPVLVKLMSVVDRYHGYTSIIGKIPSPSGPRKTQASLKWPELNTDIKEAARQLGVKIDGAIVG